MMDVLLQILLVTVFAGFPTLAIVANFMRHRLEAADERSTLPTHSGLEDGMIPLVLTFNGSPAEESKRAA